MPNESVTQEAAATHDVVVVSDLRLPAEVPTSLPDEIAAQGAAGYTTALADIPRGPAAPLRSIHPGLQHCIRRGLADLVYGNRAAHGRLLIVRDVEAFRDAPAQVAKLGGDQRVVVAESPSLGGAEDLPDGIERAHRAVTARFGSGFVWAPADPFVRDAIAASGADIPLMPWDWTATIDVENREVVRPPLSGRRPVIGGWTPSGGHGRPASAEEVLAATSTDPGLKVELVVPAWQPSEPTAIPPSSWTARPLAASSLPQFLARIDLLLLLEGSDWPTATLRVPLEALASGAVPVLPEPFRRVFEDACRYGHSRLDEVIDSLTADPDRHRTQLERGRAMARQFGPDVHLGRLRSLISPPSRRSTLCSADGHGARGAVPVLFVSSNGVGMGHLTRLMAMARHASPAIRPFFLTASQAVGPVRSLGFPCDYVPAKGYLGCSGPRWNALLHQRINEAIDHHQPRAVVFDGTSPYVGLLRARADHPHLPFVWSRRAMWQEGKSQWAIDQSEAFDRVIEPGEIAADYDRGRTVPLRDSADHVPPITLLDADELLQAEEARTALGLDPARAAALVHLGAGNLNDTAPIADAMIGALAQWPDLQICVTSAAIAERPVARPQGVTVLSVHPISRYLQAFDVAVSAAGYNSFHELVRARVPTIFVPNTATQLDDQLARARYAHDHGLGRLLTDPRDAEDVVAALMDDKARQDVRQRCEVADVGNGAGQAMDLVERLAIPRIDAQELPA